MAPSKVDLGPITEEEVAKAITRSGYPLEVRIFEQFHARGLDPEIGKRVMTEDGASEVDVLGTFEKVYAWLHPVVEAKNMMRRGFVGFPWNLGARDAFTHRLRGIRFDDSGAPVGENELAKYLDHTGQLGLHLERLNQVPFCVQHAIVWRDKNNNEPLADQEGTNPADRFTVSLEKMVRVVCTLERERLPKRDNQLRVHLFQPTLVVDTPKLFLFDVTSSTQVTQVDRLMRPMTIKVGDRLETRLVDVVTADALPSWLDLLRDAWEGFHGELCSRTADLERMREARTRETIDAIAGPMSGYSHIPGVGKPQ